MRSSKHLMVTCYDATFARIVGRSAAMDSVLVGDSLGNVIQGKDSTTEVTMEQMLYHIAAVARGLHSSGVSQLPLLIGDMPIHSYETAEAAIKNAHKILNAGAEMVKVEGPVLDVVKALRDEGIRVCGHIGLTPQSIQDYKVQGKTDVEAERLLAEAQALDVAGVELLVLEMIPAALAKKITESVSAVTIGIGAGPDCGGQVLVIYDLLGLNPDFNPKFLKKYGNGFDFVSEALKNYSTEVRMGEFPGEKNSFGVSSRGPSAVV